MDHPEVRPSYKFHLTEIHTIREGWKRSRSRQIRDLHDTYKTFDAYCQAEWGVSKNTINTVLKRNGFTSKRAQTMQKPLSPTLQSRMNDVLSKLKVSSNLSSNYDGDLSSNLSSNFRDLSSNAEGITNNSAYLAYPEEEEKKKEELTIDQLKRPHDDTHTPNTLPVSEAIEPTHIKRLSDMTPEEIKALPLYEHLMLLDQET